MKTQLFLALACLAAFTFAEDDSLEGLTDHQKRAILVNLLNLRLYYEHIFINLLLTSPLKK
jgi:hypothetical protein